MRSLVLLLLTTAGLPGQVVPVTVHGSVMVATVRLNGQGPFRMIVDTGASSCSIAPRVAALLQLKPEYRVLEVSPTGRRFIPGTRSVEVDMGTRTAQNVEFLWQESSGLTEAGLQVDGILGQSFLSRFDYLLDYQLSELVLDSAGPPPATIHGKRIPFTIAARRMLLPAMNPSEGSMRLVLDSAASNLTLWRADFHPALNRSAGLIAINGRRDVSLIHIPLLVVGGQVLQRLDALVAPNQDHEQVEDGLLPAVLFRSIYVSNSERYVTLRR